LVWKRKPISWAGMREAGARRDGVGQDKLRSKKNRREKGE
jgi:hypothetical protein